MSLFKVFNQNTGSNPVKRFFASAQCTDLSVRVQLVSLLGHSDLPTVGSWTVSSSNRRSHSF